MATTRQGLSDFLVRLGDEPELFEEYMEDRAGLMEREGVAPADRDAILSGDLREIRARLRSGYAAMVVMEGEPPDEEPPTVMKPEEEPPTVMEPEEQPPTVMEPEEQPPTVMAPEEPPTVMKPEEEPPTVMAPEEPPTVMEPDTESDPEPEQYTEAD